MENFYENKKKWVFTIHGDEKQKDIKIKDSVKSGIITKNNYNSNKNIFFCFFHSFYFLS